MDPLQDIAIFGGRGNTSQVAVRAAQYMEAPFRLYSSTGLIDQKGAPSPSPVVITCLKCNSLSKAVEDNAAIWKSAKSRIVLGNGMPEATCPHCAIDGYIIVNSGIRTGRNGKLVIIAAGMSVIAPSVRPFAPDVADILAECATGFTASGMPTKLVNDVTIGAELRWKKLVANAIANPLAAILRLPMARLAAEREVHPVIEAIIAEANAVAAAHGIAYRETTSGALAFLAAGRSHLPTTALDIIRGKASEIRWLTGTIVALGAAYGVATPVNRLVLHLTESEMHLTAQALRTLASHVAEFEPEPEPLTLAA